ncbi:hypothetical protein OPT61_g7148 [Boeremia exigua]|uniref:Uncharacterized protein n=1 Tax=Boeremia exigua TaxID=749465 RepID=A0ACC2I3D5_9PLEO|nr:hypothetical protein OPT61_g7148 [Boeremia exigua]
MRRKTPVPLLLLSLQSFLMSAGSSDAVLSNANHIFNAIHSSMRQWGGSLNHNGMTMFLATVPEGTQLYHGTSSPDFVKGMQWLAFEPEHALIFARPPRQLPSGGERSRLSHGREHGDLEGMSHDEQDRGTHQLSPEYGHSDEHKHDPPPPPPPHERKLCSSTGSSPSLPLYDECRSRKHREHGPPPPLPPGHIYKPYPPPPRKDRSYEGPRRPWNVEHRRSPSADRNNLPEHHEPLLNRVNSLDQHPSPSSQHNWDHDTSHEPLELRSVTANPQKRHSQQPLRDPTPASEEERVGYLHTYAPTHELHLLYIDGLSAGKTRNGTLDTQDLLLLNLTTGGPREPGHPMGDEMARANGLCELAATVWQNRIDGIIRMEGGFEIILCDFAAHLQRIDVPSHRGTTASAAPA